MITLQTICISGIVKDFKRFHLAFKETNDVVVRRGSELLRRNYSSQLLSGLFQERNLEDEYLEILLNEHLKHLDGQWILRNYDGLQHCDDYVRVTLTENILCHLPDLREISFPRYCFDGDMRNIARFCSKLTEIDVTGSLVTDNGIEYICEDENGKCPCSELRKVFIRSTYVTREGVKYLLKSLPSIEMIDDCQQIPTLLHSLHMDFPQRVYNFTFLDLYEISDEIPNYYEDVLKTCLTVCPKLKRLRYSSVLHERELNLLSTVKLEKLDLVFSEANPRIHLSTYFKNSIACNLTFLAVEKCMVTVSDVAASCPKLKYLALWDVFYQDDDVSQYVFHSLVRCIFAHTKVDSSTNNAIQSILQLSPKLEDVGFDFCVLSPNTKINILKFCENHLIKKISFMRTIVELHLLKDILSSFPPSATLNINDNDCCARDIKELAGFAETLPNKPQITVCEWPLTEFLNSFNFDWIVYFDKEKKKYGDLFWDESFQNSVFNYYG